MSYVFIFYMVLVVAFSLLVPTMSSSSESVSILPAPRPRPSSSEPRNQILCLEEDESRWYRGPTLVEFKPGTMEVPFVVYELVGTYVCGRPCITYSKKAADPFVATWF
jgi:hypothetical protein